MSAVNKTRMLIDVTRGDCVDDNRKNGKSNTGTYFVCSIKNFDEFEHFFQLTNKYKIDLVKVDIYKTLFKQYFFQYKDEYIGKMKSFDIYINYLISQSEFPCVDITTRKNDTRVFMKFVDNTKPIVNAFRHVLYEDLSFIVFEKRGETIYLYPEINETLISKKKFENSDLVIDE